MSDEPDRYSLDEMMERLRRQSQGKSAEQSETVIREDGSKTVKVRRRKRRSQQPKKEKQRGFRMFKVTVAFVAIILTVLAVGLIMIYVNTAFFRQQVADKLSVATGADVKLQQFRMNPIGLNVHGVDFDWPDGNVLDNISVRLVSADVWLTTVLTGRLTGHELTAGTAKLTLRKPDLSEPTRLRPKHKGKPPVQFAQCNITDFEIHIDGRMPGAFRLTGSEATFMPAQKDRPTLLRLSNGNLRMRGWPMLSLDRAYIEFNDQQANIVGANFSYANDEEGQLKLSGVIKPYTTNVPCVLSVEAKSFPLSGLAGEQLGRIIEGTIDTVPDSADCQLKINFGEPNEVRLSMLYQVSSGESLVIQNLPFLYSLSQLLGDDWYSRPDFWDVAGGLLLNNGSRITISNIEFNRRDRLAIRGKLALEHGLLSGNLKVGIAPGIIQSTGDKVLNTMFSNQSGGFRWIELAFSGTPEAPTDNFVTLYENARIELSDASQPESNGLPSGGSSFEELTRPR